MRISGESVDKDIPSVITRKEHAKTALDSDQEFSLTGSKESTMGVSEECSDETGLNCDSNNSQSRTAEEKGESTESSNGSGVPVVMPVYPVGTLNAMGGNIEQDEKFSKDCSNSLEQKALESESVNLDETVHSAGIFNSTGKNNGKDENDTKHCSYGSDRKTVKRELGASKVTSATEETAHSVGNTTDKNKGKT